MEYLQAIFSLIFVLALIGICSLILKKFAAGQLLNIRNLNKEPKTLKIIETTLIDGKNKLVLVQRNDTKHLILIGSTQNILIEGGIKDAEKN